MLCLSTQAVFDLIKALDYHLKHVGYSSFESTITDLHFIIKC
jgi:hypothetical protein